MRKLPLIDLYNGRSWHRHFKLQMAGMYTLTMNITSKWDNFETQKWPKTKTSRPRAAEQQKTHRTRVCRQSHRLELSRKTIKRFRKVSLESPKNIVCGVWVQCGQTMAKKKNSGSMPCTLSRPHIDAHARRTTNPALKFLTC